MNRLATFLRASARPLAAVIVMISAPLAAQDSLYGALGLVDAPSAADYEAALEKLERSLDERGCSLEREGPIVGSNGSLEAVEANHFVLAVCPRSKLPKSGAGSLLDSLRRDGVKLAFAQGPLADVTASVRESSGKGRVYIFKLSRFNRADPAKRIASVAAINETVSTIEGAFRPEGSIFVAKTKGLDGIDEVAVLSYPDPAAAARFRESHPEILETIGAFNETYVRAFLYVTASSNR